MKRILILTLLAMFLTGCSKTGDCYYNGKPLNKGPKGGCYYITDKGNKEYVDRSACNCD